MYDSIDYRTIPTDAELVAGYVDGPISTWPAAGWSAFPNAEYVRISTWGPRHNGNCLDVEKGDSVPGDIPDWEANARSRGVQRPIIYCSLSAWGLCLQMASGADVQWWIAHYTQVAHLCSDECLRNAKLPLLGKEADATQYNDQGAYDTSLCSPTFHPG